MYKNALCLDEELLFHPRFRRGLTGYERADLLYVLFMARQGKNPAFIPAAKLDDVRLRLDIREDVWGRRLAKWEAQRLVRQSVDGLDITLLWSDEDDEEEDAPVPSAALLEADPDAAKRAKDRERQRKSRALKKQGQVEEGPAAPERPRAMGDVLRGMGALSRPAVTPAAAGGVTPPVTENVTLSGGDVTKSVTLLSQPVTPGVTPPYVDVNVDVSEKEDSIAISSSGDVNVTSRTVTPPVTENVTLSGGDVTENVTLAEQQTLAARRKNDVVVAMKAAGDSPKWTPQWNSLWNHCEKHGQLALWPESLTILTEDIRVGRLPRNLRPAQWLRGILREKLREAGCPLPSGTAEERADVQQQIRESLQLPPAPNNFSSSSADAPSEPPLTPDKTVRSITQALGDESRTGQIAALVDLAAAHGQATLPRQILDITLARKKDRENPLLVGAAEWFCKMLAQTLHARKVPVPENLRMAAPEAVVLQEGDEA